MCIRIDVIMENINQRNKKQYINRRKTKLYFRAWIKTKIKWENHIKAK